MRRTSEETRRHLLAAACQVFANHGYEGASVAQIVALARVTKPALYYHFGSKAGLHEALVNEAIDQRFRQMQEAAVGASTLEEKLTRVLEACFRHAHLHREVTRVCFTAGFAAPGEVPHRARFMQRGVRNFDFVLDLIRQGIRDGELPRSSNARELATALYSRVIFNSLAQVVHAHPPRPPSARAAVRLFLRGAAAG